MSENKNEILTMLDQAEELYHQVNDLPHGGICYDADSILTDYLTEVPIGMFRELSNTYRTCENTDVFEMLFEMMTGITFQEYLERCLDETRLLALPKGSKIMECNPKQKLLVVPQEHVWVVTNAFGVDTEAVGKLDVKEAIVQRVCIMAQDGLPQYKVDLVIESDKVELSEVPLSSCYESYEEAEQARMAMLVAADNEDEADDDEDESDPPVIDSFRGDYAFLSNFYLCPIAYKGKNYLCAEAAFQAQKCPERADEFTTLTAPKAKRLGRQVTITVDDWDAQRVSIMGEVVWEKFAGNPTLAEKLLETGDAQLEEGNTWGDVFWGTVDGEGENNLGKILMEVRQKLQELKDSSV